nr:MAG TPA: hypothetical protein [Bacteriophage sp.]
MIYLYLYLMRSRLPKFGDIGENNFQYSENLT